MSAGSDRFRFIPLLDAPQGPAKSFSPPASALLEVLQCILAHSAPQPERSQFRNHWELWSPSKLVKESGFRFDPEPLPWEQVVDLGRDAFQLVFSIKKRSKSYFKNN